MFDQPPDCTPVNQAIASYNGSDMRRFGELMRQQMECARLRQASWSPIEDVAAQGRQVRRASFNRGRLDVRIPSVALEKTPDGVVTIRVSIDRPRRIFSATVPADVWQRIAALDAAATAPQPKQPPRDPSQSIVMGCHGEYVDLEAADLGASWRQSLNSCAYLENAPVFSYAYALADLAAGNISECAGAKAQEEGKSNSPTRGVEVLIRCAGRFSPRTTSNP